MDKDKTMAFIYKREVIQSDDKEYVSFTYKLVDVTIGLEITDENCLKEFVDKKGNHYSFINDTNNLNDEYVYAFPENINKYNDNEIDQLLIEAKKRKDAINDYVLFQIYSLYSKTYNNNYDYLQTYSMDANNTENFIVIDPYSAEGTIDMLSSKYEEIEKTKAHIEENKEKISTPTILYSNDIYDNVRKTVICQDDQIKAIASSIAKNSRITDPRLKDNLLVCGPSGVGKSEIFRCISNMTNLPITMEDSNEYTASGYKGKDVTDMLVNLYLNANKDIEKAQRGIIIIDEIDKKISKRDEIEVYTKAVLDSLLKMAEGHTYHIEQHNLKFDIDTSFITFAMLGAFSGIEDYNKTKRNLGFVTEEEKEENKKTTNSYTEQTLLKYGLKPEFLGRSKLIVMNDLGMKDFCKIINESDKSHLQLYKYLFNDLGINFIYDEDTIEAIAKKAVELGVGARSIKKIIENAFEVINYEVFSKNNYKELIITPETIEDNTKFILR